MLRRLGGAGKEFRIGPIDPAKGGIVDGKKIGVVAPVKAVISKNGIGGSFVSGRNDRRPGLHLRFGTGPALLRYRDGSHCGD
ncbi:hypothetical protein [uncultured Bosea sp.]|uniref:hypothetical protein n=1 Tax=uncultured Bosea sp. TaxID=211457 RepID=UPI0025E1165C|nr:hypothetical protein [uncultured Bosea sp.]